MDVDESDIRPAKRARLSPDLKINNNHSASANQVGGAGDNNTSNQFTADSKEIEVGITAFTSQRASPFQAIVKKRYTDFVVSEILPSGEVVHLSSTTVFNRKETSESGPDKQENVSSYKSGEARIEGSVDDKENTANKDLVKSEPPTSTGQAEKKDEVSDEDRKLLVSYFNDEDAAEILELYNAIRLHPKKKSKDHALVRIQFTDDRSLRGEIHGAIRRIFSSKIESSTDKEGFLCLTAANPKNQRNNQQQAQNGAARPRPGKLGWADRGGDYVHFTLCKENKDTMEAISFLARSMKINAKAFQFAGTKDRRAVTTQRVSAYHVEAERLAGLNRVLRNAAVGDFEYQKFGLELGDLGGNEFELTLRELVFPELEQLTLDQRIATIQADLETRFDDLYEKGHLNYYGLQRFGTFTERTDTIGLHILRGDFKSACDAILHYKPELDLQDKPESEAPASSNVPHSGPSNDEIQRAKAIYQFQVRSDTHKAIELLPRKFTAENQLFRHLSRSPNDYAGALLTIPRNLRMMYVHAYQSLVWNKAVTHRWQLYGDKMVEGDLVLVREHKGKEPSTMAPSATNTDNGPVDADGEIIVTAPVHDRANSTDDMFERARPLTSAEASSGQYTIFDLVLPLPGYDILYPSNPSGAFYKDFMSSDEGGNLDPYDMRRKQRDFSLSGSYRKALGRIGRDWRVNVVRYARDEEQFVKTDLERIGEGRQQSKSGPWSGREEKRKGDGSGGGGGDDGDADMDVDVKGNGAAGAEPEPVKDKIAAVLKFQLGSSQYATMVLRELSRGGIVSYNADLSHAK